MSIITLKDAFEELFGRTKYDNGLVKKCKLFQVNFVHSNQENREFFGGNIIGVHRVRFTHREIIKFYDEIIGKDESEVTEVVRRVTTINHEFKISGDVMNLTIMYFIHRFLNSPLLNEKNKHEACKDLVLIFLYRTLSALLATYFKYPIDKETGQAVYERLSGRYLIKKLGNWQAVFNYRADEFINKKGIHYNVILAFKDDSGIVNAINDLQSRLKDTIKNIYGEFMYVHEHGTKIISSSSTMIDADGEEIIKDKVHGLETYQHYILIVMEDYNSFVKQELLLVISRVIPTVGLKGFNQLLQWMCSELSASHKEEVIKFTNLSLSMAFNYLLENDYVLHRSKDIVILTAKLKGFILSSRKDSEELIEFRKQGDSIIKMATKYKTNQMVSSLRNGLFLYICLRAFTKHAYS